MRGDPCEFLSFSVTCTLADRTRSKFRDAVKLHVKLMGFAWDHEFKVLEGCFPVILGLDFFGRTRMVIDVSSRKYSFGFSPYRSGAFGSWQEIHDGEHYLQSLVNEASQWLGGINASSILVEFPQLFSSTMGTADCAPYEIELTDLTPFRST